MKFKLLLIPLLTSILFVFNEKPAYQLYNAKGKKVKYSKMLEKIAEADIVLFGELHNNPICHWLQLELIKDLHKARTRDFILGAEMFESDNQLIIDEYFAGKYNTKKFEAEMKLWKNYKTDYKPLLEYAKKNELKFVASNVPRRYANMVYKGGFESLDSLSKEASNYFAKLPVKYDPELKCYNDMLEMSKEMHGEANPNFPKAQAIKDATMAEFILKNFEKGKLFLHFQGSYHSDNYQGIFWYLQKQNPDLKIVTISTKEQEDISKLDEESEKVADYVIVVPGSMTKTY